MAALFIRNRGLRTLGLVLSATLAGSCAAGVPKDASLDPNGPFPTGIFVTPDADTVFPGKSATFSASAHLSDGSDVSGFDVNWTATGGTVTGSGKFTAGSAAGVFTVSAKAGGLTGTATVRVVEPTLSALEIDPGSVSLQTSQVNQFTVSGTLSDGSDEPSPDVTWTATGGSITQTGRYTAGSTGGAFRVIASADGVADTALVTITTSTITAITLTPPSVSLLSGQAQQFSVSARLSDGSNVANPGGITWNASGGTVTSAGRFTAGGVAGTAFRVIATATNGTADTSAVTVTAPSVTGITLNPPSTSVVPGTTQQFTASATLSNGSTQSNPAVTFSATGGTITQAGLYTAGSTLGTFSVTAQQQVGTFSATSQVFIVVADTTEPAFRSGVDNMVWADNIDRYYNTQDMQWNFGECGNTLPDGHPATAYGARTQPNNDFSCDRPDAEYDLVAGRGGSGKALRSIVHADPGHAQQSVAWLAPWQPNGMNYSGRKVVIQYWVRISAGGTPGTFGMKWMEAWFVSSSRDQNRIQWSNESGTDARPLFHMVLGSNPGGSIIRTRQPIGPYWDQFNDGQWHRVTHLWVLNTTSSYSNTGGNSSATETYSGTSSRDGRIAMWIDGKKMMDYSQATVGVRPAGGTGVWATQGDVDFIPGVGGSNSVGKLSFLEFPGVFNGSPGAWTLDHDDMQIWAQP